MNESRYALKESRPAAPSNHDAPYLTRGTQARQQPLTDTIPVSTSSV